MARIRFNSISLPVLLATISVSATGTLAGAAPAPTQVTSATPAVTDLKKQISAAMLAGRCDEAKELAIKAVEFDLAEQVVRLCVPKGQGPTAPRPPLASFYSTPMLTDLKLANELYSQKRYSEAFRLYEQATLAGSGEAANMMGNSLLLGFGVEKNVPRAIDSYKLAASRGDKQGHYNLGVLNYKGQGIQRNYAEAFLHFQKAAELGDAESQNYLGLIYENGFSVPKNLPEAIRWYNAAALSGSAFAQENISRLIDSHLASEADRAIPTSGNHAQMWKRKPTPEQLAAFYPNEAILTRTTGRVVVKCNTDERGNVGDCSILEESPTNMGFGSAALKLAKLNEFTPRIVNGKPVAGSVVVPLRFILSDSMFDRLIKALTAQKR